jgi:hypothetical protein
MGWGCAGCAEAFPPSLKRKAKAATQTNIDRYFFEHYVQECLSDSLALDRERNPPWTQQRVNTFFDKNQRESWFKMNPDTHYTYPVDRDSTLSGTVLHILKDLFDHLHYTLEQKLRTIDPCIAILKYLIDKDPRLARFSKISDALRYDKQLGRIEFRQSADFSPPLIFIIEHFARPNRGIPDAYVSKLCKVFVDAWKPSLSIRFAFGDTPLQFFYRWSRQENPMEETVKVLTTGGNPCCVQ